jgi:hypothetical protein
MKNLRATLASAISRHAATRRARAVLVTCVLVGATMAAPAMAESCPPGYRGTYPHCMPAPVKPHRPYAMHSNAHGAGVVPLTNQHHAYPIERKMIDPYTLPPHTGPGPVEHQASAADTHGIIFVGGHAQRGIDHDKSAINSQPVPPGRSLHDKGALNPQPIPPGRAPVKTGGP